MSFGAVIVNYNCAPLSLSAALSVLGDGPNTRIVIVDNASTDESLDYLQSVMRGQASHECSAPLDAIPAPHFADISKVSARRYTQDETKTAGAQISIIAAEENDGFAAGCNIGMRFLRETVDPAYYLLLNPDALIGVGALAAFADRLKDKSAGLCGASVFRHEDPNCAQAFGGAHLNAFTLLGKNIAAGSAMDDAPSCAEAEAKMSYPLGAAMAFRKDYLDNVGYLDEQFFLYYEEADWSLRGGPSRRPAWAPSAIVYHHHGTVAGSRIEPGRRSPLSDYHMARSRMLYAIKWRPLTLPLLFIGGVIQATRRLLRGHWRQAGAVLSGSLPGAPKRSI